MAYFILRVFDFVTALIAAVVLTPFLLLTMLVIRICSPGAPAVFKQQRIGYRCKPFTIFKLRTMTDERDPDGELLPDEERLEKWGKIIRKLSLA